jgi:hypothetical protein
MTMPLLLKLGAVDASITSGNGESWLLVSTALLGLGLMLEAECARRRLQEKLQETREMNISELHHLVVRADY